MLKFCLRRIAIGFVIVILAVSTIYVLVLAAPGNPITVLAGPRATPETIAAVEAKFGLDKPLPVQVFNFVTSVFQGDLGIDIRTRRPVLDQVLAQLPFTIYLIATSLVLAAGLGIPLGCVAAIYQGSFADRILGILSVSFIAVPSLIIAIYGMILFAVQLRWLPAIGPGDKGDILDQLHHLIMPTIAVGIGWVGYLARLVRAAMLEVLTEDYITNARAFGLPERWIIFRYALRIAVAPTITVLGIGVGIMLGSAVFAEIVFARPGIGKMMYDAVNTRNYPLTMGVVLASTILLVVTTTLSDIINALIDPRIREAQE